MKSCGHNEQSVNIFVDPSKEEIKDYKLWKCGDCKNYVSLLPKEELENDKQ